VPEVGINLSQPRYYSGQYAFVDRVKESEGWVARSWIGKSAALSLVLDENGWPKGLPTGANTVQTIVSMDPVALATTDRYVILYEGTGTISLSGTKVISSEPGKITVEYTSTSTAAVQWAALDILKSSLLDPVRNVSVVREDQLAAFEQGQLYNSAFIEKMDQLGTLRFMDWGRTNVNPLVNWEDRPLPSASAYDERGVPLEYMIELSNQTGQDMWYCVPTGASDDYVRKAVELIRDTLDPGLQLHLEYSNEMWNWGFEQSAYGIDQAAALWGVDANGDGKIDTASGKETVPWGHLQYYGYRSAQIAQIAEEVFGAQSDGRLVNVLTSQTDWTGQEQWVLAGAARAGVDEIGDLFDEWAITGYFNGGIGTASSDWNVLLQWAREGEAGLTKAFRQLQYGDLIEGGSQTLEGLAKIYAYYAAFATQHGLSLATYEGGQHMVATFAPAEIRDEIAAFFARIENDPRMGALFTRNIELFEAAGGDLFIAYNNVGGSSVYGGWGVLDSIYQDGSPRWDAYVQAMLLWQDRAATEWTGTSGADVKVATGTGDWKMHGGAGADTLTGGVGADMIDGEAGNDSLRGGGGNDILIGNDGSDQLRGEAGDDQLYGGDGNDMLIGGAGADIMTGGKGDDRYWVDNVKDVVVELSGEGNDAVYASVDYTLADNVERLYLVAGARTGTGNALNNLMFGTAGNDILYGLAGNDDLRGGAGADLLDGGAGNDRLYGHGGNDALRGGEGDDILDGGAGNDALFGGPGRDKLTGGAGADRFIFGNETLGTPITLADQILDFSRLQGDKIDVSLADASSLEAGDQAFSFVGDAAFSGVAGELRYVKSSAATYVMGDVNGDRVADFSVWVKGVIDFQSSDFIL